MNTFVACLVCLIVGGGCGYGFRGWIHNHLQYINDRYAKIVVDVRNVYARLEAAAAKGEAELRAEVAKVLADLKKHV